MRDKRGLIEERLRKLESILSSGFDPFSVKKFPVSAKSIEIVKRFSELEPGEETEHRVSVAGRVFAIRRHGGIAFVDLRDREGRIQTVARKDVTPEFHKFLDWIDRGDILGVSGRVIKTRKGEVSVLVEEWSLLSKALRDLPGTWYGLENPEIRYRQRYLDFVLNENARQTIFARSKAFRAIRNFLDSHGFIEVQTPVLQPIYGGASARPFETYCWAIDRKVFLSIAPELYLKRYLVAGFERVYEIARCFRNEDMDSRHHPEFTQLEFYAAYWDYRDMMDFTEKLIRTVFEEVRGNTQVEIGGKVWDFSKFERWRVPDKIKEETGIDVNQYDFEGLKEEVERLGLNTEEAQSWGELVELLREEILESLVEQPTFMYLYPKDVSPLAKPADDPRWTERFEGFAYYEFINAYTELNNPIQQFKRFEEQEELRRKAVEAGKLSEHQPMDRDFVRALEYGMPPAAGCGIGIDRLVAFLTGNESIREVIPFPLLRGDEKIETVCDLFPEAKRLYE